MAASSTWSSTYCKQILGWSEERGRRGQARWKQGGWTMGEGQMMQNRLWRKRSLRSALGDLKSVPRAHDFVAEVGSQLLWGELKRDCRLSGYVPTLGGGSGGEVGDRVGVGGARGSGSGCSIFYLMSAPRTSTIERYIYKKSLAP